MPFATSVLLKSRQPKLTEAEKNFNRLEALGILNPKNSVSFDCQSKLGAPLSVLIKANLSKGNANGNYIVSLSHRQMTAGGQTFQDPQQDILINTVKKTAQTLTFRMSDLGPCKSVYFSGREPRATTPTENNVFLTKWLSTLIMQGFGTPTAHH